MGIGADTDFDAEELAMLEALRKDDEPQAAVPAAAAPAAAPAATVQPSEQPGVTETQQQTAAPAEPASAAPAAPAQPTETPQGDPRAALRASRRAERQARERAAQLEAELEALRKQVPQQQPPASTDDLTDAELAELEQDFPVMAKAARLARQAAAVVVAQPQQPAAQVPAAQIEFMPPVLPPDLQDVVDGIPDLLAWQCNPDQTRFEMAKAADAVLLAHPQWRDKPPAERFLEVTRRVNAELGAAAAPQSSPLQQPPAATPAQVLANVPRQAPSTLSDIGAGGAGVENPLTLDRMARMSDEDILAELARLG